MPARITKKVHRAPVLVGMLDSGVDNSLASRVVASQAFVKGFSVQPARLDRLGHGSALTQIIAERIPESRFLVAQVFVDQLATSAIQAAAGLDWLVDRGAQVVNMSFGIKADRQPLAKACQRALAAGVVLVAAAPAVGAAVYPSRYPGVIRVTGDVRCGPDEFSQMDSPQAEYGACVRVANSPVAGASVATAYISMQVARYIRLGGPGLTGLRLWLKEQATYRGIPQHFDLIPPSRRLKLGYR